MNKTKVIFFFLFFCLSANAQEASARRTFRWNGVRYAVEYLFTIEKAASSGEYGPWMQMDTNDTSVELPVESGLYRYNIAARDNFGKTGPPSRWVYFNYNTRVFEWKSVLGASTYRFVLERENSDGDYAPVAVQDAKACAIDIPFLRAGRYRWQVYGRDDFGNSGPPSPYVYFEIEGEFTGENEVEVKVENKRGGRFVYDVGVLWSPLIPAGGIINEITGEDWFPETLAVDFSFFPLVRERLLFGAEAEFFWGNMAWNGGDAERMLLEGHLLGLNIAPALQIKIANRFYVKVSGGGGGVFFKNFKFREYTKYAGASFFVPDVFAGASFIFFITDKFYIEAGASFLHTFNYDKPENSYIKPTLGFKMRL